MLSASPTPRPPPPYQSPSIQDAFSPASSLLLLGLTLVTTLLAIVLKTFHMGYSDIYRKLTTVLICINVLVFLIIISAFAVGFSVNTSLSVCSAAYILCATFWLAGKGLLYLWYSEKLHSDFAFHHLSQASRWNTFYITNHFLVLGPYLIALLWIFGAYDTVLAPCKHCYIGMQYTPAVSYLLIYTVVVAVYISGSFIYPHISRPRRSSTFPAHPAVRIPPTKRQQRARRKQAFIYAGLNAVTALLPVGLLIALLIVPGGTVEWWVFVSVTAADLVLAATVASVVCWWEAGWVRGGRRGFEGGRMVCAECELHDRRGSGGVQWFTGDNLL